MTPDALHGKAKHISDRLHAMGYANAEARFIPEQEAIGCNFVLIAANPSWRKMFIQDPSDASAKSFLAMFAVWRTNMRKDIIVGKPGPVLSAAMATHGQEAVTRALEPA